MFVVRMCSDASRETWLKGEKAFWLKWEDECDVTEVCWWRCISKKYQAEIFETRKEAEEALASFSVRYRNSWYGGVEQVEVKDGEIV